MGTDLRAAALPPLFVERNATTGQPIPVNYTLTFYNGTHVHVDGRKAIGDPGLYSRPYVGGYMNSNGCSPNTYCTTWEVQAAISFPNTSPSDIPAGNFLEGTLNSQGQGSDAGIDYAIRSAHVLYPNGDHGVVADMWQVCQGSAYGCGGTWATELSATVLILSGYPANQVIYVMTQATASVVSWLYSFDDVSWTQYASYAPPSGFNHQLYLGTVNVFPNAYPYYTAYYYQFGVWAQSAYSATFNVQFQNPAYYVNGGWSTIPTAYTINGDHGFFDRTWTYGAPPTNWIINANNPNPGPTVTFYHSSSAIGENVRLWG